jgi:soluble lytic murein transglycosylase-like protein
MQAFSYSLRLAAAATMRAYAATKGLLAIVGFAAVCAFFALPVPRDTLLQHLVALGVTFPADPFSFHSTTVAGPIQASVTDLVEEREQRALTEAISKRYRVAEQAASSFVSAAYRAGRDLKVDPVLVLAVMAIESRFNPVAESNLGAKGLMQIIAKFHLEKLADHGGEHALLDPEINIYVGTRILREYLRRFGETETALQMYAGAFDEPNSLYAQKVLAEKARLEVPRQKARREAPAGVTSAAESA